MFESEPTTPRQEELPYGRRSNNVICLFTIMVAGAVLSLPFEESPLSFSVFSSSPGSKMSQGGNRRKKTTNVTSRSFVPGALYELGVYQESDFTNQIGVSPPYWNPKSNDGSGTTWGPCFPTTKHMDWYDERNSSEFNYLHDPNDAKWHGSGTISGGCRPGFIILGAGKCGTSSLYHYLLGHPRVAPAYAKQIHYFTYHLNQPMDWYYSWFPTAASFLQHGALITGEASPGYLPYPKAVKVTSELLPGDPKLIVVGRNPLTRMYSSYRYNYRDPTMEAYKSGRGQGILAHQDDEYYEPYFFSFEDFVKAELKQLRSCLLEFGPQMTRDRWYKYSWTRAEFDRRSEYGLDPLIDLDEVCYGKVINRTVTRVQWAAMQMAHPERYIPSKKVFLIQSFIGRSLYVFPLEWWYIRFPPEDILFYCTEDLSDADKFNQLSLHLGLPSYNYTPVIAQGAFNVGGNQGYDQATSWEEIGEETEQPMATSNTTMDSEQTEFDDGIPLSPETRRELLEFLRPYNERLFQLVGRRCDW